MTITNLIIILTILLILATTIQAARKRFPFEDNFQTLPELYSYFKSSMPPKGSNLYTNIQETDDRSFLDDWEKVCFQMLRARRYRRCPWRLPSRLVDLGYMAGSFHDVENGRFYCVLLTLRDWASEGVGGSPLGMFVTDPYSSPSNCLIQSSSHPRGDLYTGEQALVGFRGGKSKAFLVSGTHKMATMEWSSCQKKWYVGDPSHNKYSGFQAATKAIVRYYEQVRPCDYTVIQYHGMGASSCPGDAHMTYGGNYFVPQAGEKIDLLRGCIESSQGVDEPVITIPNEEPFCGLAGAGNMQGRYMNGVSEDDMCLNHAKLYTSHFIHTEQKIWQREFSQHGKWIEAMKCAAETLPFDARPVGPPPGCNITSPSGGDVWELGSSVTITWDTWGIFNTTFLVSLAQAGTLDYADTLEAMAPIEGMLTFRLRGSVDVGHNDRLVRLRHNKNRSIKCYSEKPFTIINPLKYIYVDNNNGGNILKHNQTLTIRWTARPDICPTVKVSWHRSFEAKGFYRTIAHDFENVGEVEYFIDPTFIVRPGYSLRVRCMNDVYIHHFSFLNGGDYPSDFYEVVPN